MKKYLALFALFTACGSNHSSHAIRVQSSLDNDPACPSDSEIACYPEGSPARRNDLYECKNGGSAHAWIEFMNDKSRVYHVWMTLPGDLRESFIATESSEAAQEFTPIAYGLGQPQSSRVLHGIPEATGSALGLPVTSNFLFTLVGGGETHPVTLTMAVDSGESLGIADLSCLRVGN